MNGQQINPPQGFEQLVNQGFNFVSSFMNQQNSETSSKNEKMDRKSGSPFTNDFTKNAV